MAVALALPLRLMGGDAPDADERLVARLRAGELAALGEAYDAHHEHVRAFARRMIGEDAAAEDLVQETFVGLPRAVRRFRGDASLRTFLVAIAVNHARHYVRAAARRRAAVARFAREPAGSVATPAEDVARVELATALVRALDALPLEQRVAIVLCDVEERTSAEVAKIVGAPEGTVRTRVFHARRKLAELLGKEGSR